MSTLEWAAQLAVIALLGATLPMALRLERALRALRADRAALEAGAAGMGEASRQADAALARLREGAQSACREVNARLAAAEAIRDDLRYLLERGEAMADRLEGAVQQARPLATPPAAPAGPRSEAERELARALGLRS
ncbi:DUF6468 domain-containing protein [Roseococcus sp. DSY-14]|uniref:DUF6468 domain-containing protein n=1 Tax=Roseococcus sp. DSY-14 TaxID=3369650 RepID=UPI00387B0DC3